MTVPPLTQLGPVARIGLLADTHCHAPGARDLPQAVLDAFRGADLVVHLGDMGEATVLDRLQGVAKAVVATLGRDDPGDAPAARVIEAGGLVVGALFDLAQAGLGAIEDDRVTFPDGTDDARLSKVFGRRVDVVAFAATHRDLIAHHRGILYVNPGSATLPARPPATAAFLDLRNGVATVEMIRIG